MIGINYRMSVISDENGKPEQEGNTLSSWGVPTAEHGGQASKEEKKEEELVPNRVYNKDSTAPGTVGGEKMTAPLAAA